MLIRPKGANCVQYRIVPTEQSVSAVTRPIGCIKYTNQWSISQEGWLGLAVAWNSLMRSRVLSLARTGLSGTKRRRTGARGCNYLKFRINHGRAN